MSKDERFTWKTVHGWHTGAFLVVMNGLDAKNKRLKQENEQLKQQNEVLENTIESLTAQLAHGIEDLMGDVE